ncbi:MAG: uracil-DNA glycosylase family protein, partial [Verrucomicrobiota bacterium]
MQTTLPNRFPLLTDPNFRLAIIGECPNPHDFAQQKPFSGTGGNLLTGALNACSVMPSSCFLGYVCQSIPPNGDIETLDKSSYEITNGLRVLREDLNKFQPHCTLYLGSTALWAAGSWHKIHTFRGSLFRDTHGRKAISTFAPGYINKCWDDSPLFQFDVARAVSEANSGELNLPQRKLSANMSPSEVLNRLSTIPEGTLVSVDIEGGVPDPTATTYKHLDGVTCIGISTDPLDAFIIPLQDFDDNIKGIVMQEFCKMMANPRIPKVLQNSLYDYTVLAWLWKIPTANVRYDTMLSGWEIYPELPKGLGTQASIWTREPYYKFERTAVDTGDGRDSKTIHYEYCCKDAAVTLEIHNAHMAAMTPAQRQH